jgi:serine/threonine protein kinase
VPQGTHSGTRSHKFSTAQSSGTLADGLRYCPRCRSIYTAHVEFCGIDGSGLVQTDADPLVGHEVDRYLVLERVGVGAMGCVYRVQHTVLEQEHAMKILYGDLGQDERIVERFKREAKAISKMRHPNILSVTDFGRTANGLTFLVMEYVPGATLEQTLQFEGRFSAPRAARILEQIASGLGEAHRNGFVHRDVKPANIMLGQEKPELVKILDFGIVGLRTEAFDTRLTNQGFLIGTPAYMSPEQARDPSAVTPAADFYSLGVMLFEMLTGRIPFEAAQPIEMIIQHSSQPVPALPPSSGLERIASWMLEKHPERRPQNAEAILTELARLDLQDDTVEVPIDATGMNLLETIDEDEEVQVIAFEVPMLPPVTYQGNQEMVVHYEGLKDRLYRIHETLILAPEIESDVRKTMEARLAEMHAAVRPGLRAFRYVDLAAKINELERELMSTMQLRPA